MKNQDTEKTNIEDYVELINNEGIVVIDNITSMPVYGQPYMSEYYVFSISHMGYLTAQYDMRPVRFNPHEIAIVYPKHILLTENSSDDYCASVVVVSDKAFRDLSSQVTFRNRFRYEQNPSFHLNNNQYNDILRVIDTMKLIGKSGISTRRLLMTNLLEILLELTEHFRHQNCQEPDNAPHRLSARFFESIILHHREQHSVAFYADKLCLSPKYFSDVIKQETGKSAKHWICHYIVTEGKKLLRTRQDLNIQEISMILGFDDQASFSRLFKKFAGASPTDYRQRPTNQLPSNNPEGGLHRGNSPKTAEPLPDMEA